MKYNVPTAVSVVAGPPVHRPEPATLELSGAAAAAVAAVTAAEAAMMTMLLRPTSHAMHALVRSAAAAVLLHLELQLLHKADRST